MFLFPQDLLVERGDKGCHPSLQLRGKGPSGATCKDEGVGGKKGRPACYPLVGSLPK